MKKPVYLWASLLAVLLLTSCASRKNFVYLQDMEMGLKYPIETKHEAVVHRDDRLSITVSCKNPELAIPFNIYDGTFRVGTDGSVTADASSKVNEKGYRVDVNGEIDFPILGKLHIEGMKVSEVRDLIKQKIEAGEYMKDPLVSIEFLNFKYTVLGAVGSNGTYTVDGDRVTLLEAIAKAGDLTSKAKVDRVAVIREIEGERQIFMHDLRTKDIYNESPVLVSLPDALPEQSFSFTMTLKDAKTVTLSDFSGIEAKPSYEVALNDTVAIIEGMNVVVTATNYLRDSWLNTPIRVQKLPVESMVNYYKNALGIQQEEEEASILTLALKDSSPARAEDVLNTLITVYNEEAIKEKNQVAVNTANFINERLIIIERELGNVESNLESFKQRNQIVDIASSAGMYMTESQKYNADAMELETQLRLANFIKDYLTDPSKETDLIPSNTGISDMNIENQISLYNAAKLKRDHLIDDSSVNNPVVQELNNSLRAMKQSIIRAVDNMIVSLNVKRNDAQNREMRAQDRVTAIPTKERQMLSIERQQKIKEALYLFLLNKREENALSQAMADNNARVIDGAEGSNAPISPNRNRILLLGLLVGIALPGAVCLAILFMDTRVHGRKDIEGVTSVPYLGEIPLDKEAMKDHRKKVMAVKEQGDDIVSEAFRILRTNMAFLSKKDKPAQVITFTSFNIGAGKTFIARNLSMSLAYMKKRVVMVDLDIRKGTLSRHFGHYHVGVTNYLSDNTVKVDDIIQHQEGFDLIPAGILAPNPAELLMDNRLDELMNELRTRYDYIIADNVPVGLIADATIANRIADLTIFVVRAGKLDRRQLPDIEKLYQEKKLKNMALVLNGANPERHGYGYSYGYGYGYGYRTKKKKTFF
ncbi:polysaccharide biosynthesis tyrosine autokinase [Phocaeicola plebeius]|uniref:polysaccharide biosynthesis tyrosine autokinase n=1 Tax=Phocaeicola plebeius TaxID=310297 RepID=UPI0026EA5BC2|nr:polysaccharide biosynthesis tyrosine autokinase [Phocaeicola plebeius]